MSNETKQLTPWQNFFDKDYLGSHEFENDETKKVVILKAEERLVTKPGGKKDKCLVIEFDNSKTGKPVKPMVVNVTNSKAIQAISGSRFVENWPGVSITLYVDHKVKFAGSFVDGIRVKIEEDMKPQKDHLHKDHPAWDKCVAALTKGYEVADLRKKYNIVESVESELVKAASEKELAQ